MFKYNESKNVLTISKIPVKDCSTVYKDSDAYISYKKYVEHGLLRDIQELLIPKLNEAVGGSDEFPIIEVKPENCSVRYDTTSTYKGHAYNTAFVKLSSTKVPVGKPFAIFKLPYMDNTGLLYREGKPYVVKNALVQDDDITFDDKALKIVTKQGCVITMKQNASGPYISYRDKKYNAVKVMIALAVKEGLDPKELLSKIKDMNIMSKFSDEQIKYEIEYSVDELNSVGLLDALDSDAYDLSEVRPKLNQLLSLDRALGCRLFRSITLSTGEILNAEDIIMSSTLQKIKKDGINEIYVEEVHDLLGHCLAERIYLPFLRKGTEMLPIIKNIVPDYNGLYLDRNIKLDEPIILFENTDISPGLLNLLAYNGVCEVKVKQQPNSKIEKVLHFEREIVGNNHFTKKAFGEGLSTEYIYLNKNGEAEPPKKHLCAYDVLAMISLFRQLVKGQDLEYVSSIDLGLRKKVNQVNELFHQAFKSAVPDFVRMCKTKMKYMLENHQELLYNPDEMETFFFALSEIWWQKLGSSDMRVLDMPDFTNPVAFQSSLSKICSIVKDKHAVKDEQRGLSMGHYGRICPYETPSSNKLGIVNNKATGCLIKDNKMYTSYYIVKHVGEDSYITKEKLWLTVEEEESYRIGCLTALEVDSKGKILTKGEVLARIPTSVGLEKVTVGRINVSMLDLVNTDPQQHLSYATTTIPFQGADDAVRVSFEVGMCKQANAVVDAEVPIVMTSATEEIVRLNPYFMIQAEYDGEVVDVVAGSITVYYYEIQSEKNYTYNQFEFNINSAIIRTLQVKEGDSIKAGDVLVSSNFTKDGYLAMGLNALVGYIPMGTNYEDAVHMSKSMQQRMTAYVVNKEIIKIPSKHENPCVLPYNAYKYIQPGSVMFGLSYRTDTGFFKKRIDSKKLKGFLVRTETIIDEMSKAKSILVHSVSLNKEQSGDKQANRHGNKGVTPPPVDDYEMPKLLNGRPLDICYNPLGVISRMNEGQILECNLGLACLVLGTRVRSDSFNGASSEDIKYLLSYAWQMANGDDPEVVSSKFNKLPLSFRKVCISKIDSIRIWKSTFNEDGTAWLYDSQIGKLYNQPVVIGVNYVYKLEHESGKKLHARGGFCTEPYLAMTNCPPKGSSNSGGQKFGNMELYALGAYGASALQQEILNERSDNAVRRNNLTVDALHKGDKYSLPEDTAIRRSTEYFLYAIEALGIKAEFDDNELPNTSIQENKRKKEYSSVKLLVANDVTGEEEHSVQSGRVKEKLRKRRHSRK